MEETGRQRGAVAGDLATAGGLGSSGLGPRQTHADSEHMEAACFNLPIHCMSCKFYLVGASEPLGEKSLLAKNPRGNCMGRRECLSAGDPPGRPQQKGHVTSRARTTVKEMVCR